MIEVAACRCRREGLHRRSVDALTNRVWQEKKKCGGERQAAMDPERETYRRGSGRLGGDYQQARQKPINSHGSRGGESRNKFPET